MVRDKALYAVGIFVLLLALGGCQGERGVEPTPTFIPTPVVPTSPEYVVQRGDVVHEQEFSGRVTPVKVESLYFQTDGRVRGVYVTRNQWVEEGTVVADLDAEDLLNRFDLAELSLQTAQNALEAAMRDHERSRSQAQIDLRTRELQLAIAVAQDTEPEVRLAEVGLERATAALAWAEEEYDRALARPWQGPDALRAYKSALDQAGWAHREAQARYDQALQNDAAHGYQVSLLRAEVERAQLELDWLEIGVDSALTQTVQSAQLVLDGLQAQVDRTRIVAPFDGQVLSLGIVEGKDVQAYNPVATLAGEGGLEVTAELGQNTLTNIAVGMSATVEAVNVPGRMKLAEVRALPRTTGPVEDRDPVTHIRLLDTGDIDLGVDDLVTVRVILEERRGVLWLPPEAIRTYAGRRFVVVREGGVERRVDVRLGAIGEGRVEILEGLDEGLVVIAP